jgi:hypothetical protein
MRSRSKTLYSKVHNVFALSPDRFKTIERVQTALDNLVSYSYASVNFDNQYLITELGKTIPYAIAEHRRQKNKNLKDDR